MPELRIIDDRTGHVLAKCHIPGELQVASARLSVLIAGQASGGECGQIAGLDRLLLANHPQRRGCLRVLNGDEVVMEAGSGQVVRCRLDLNGSRDGGVGDCQIEIDWGRKKATR